MALKQCKECGNEVSTKAESCPKCGAILKKKMGCLGQIISVFLVLFILWMISDIYKYFNEPTWGNTPISSESKSPKIYKEGDIVNVGYTSYIIAQSWWSSRSSDNSYINDKPDAMFLFVSLSIQNNDKEARSIPPFKLIDEAGAEYETTSKGWAVKGVIGALDSLNPGVKKQGIILFDVPQNHKYKLKVSGGYWSGNSALITISPN